MVVTHGTGRRARGELFVEMPQTGLKVRVPSFGKTGTTNDFSRATMRLPPFRTQKKREPLDPDNSLTIAAYVGYDFNKMMRRGRQNLRVKRSIATWTDFAKGSSNAKYIDLLDPLDLTVLTSKSGRSSFLRKQRRLSLTCREDSCSRGGGAVDNENFATTNLAASGEQFQDIYALTASSH